MPKFIKARVEQLKSMGLCPRCGQRPAVSGKLHCRECLDYQRQYQKVAYQEDKVLVFAAYGGAVCVGCGEMDMECLSIDHVNGNGAQHRRQIGNKLYPWLVKNHFPSGFRVLCMNCQWRAKAGTLDAFIEKRKVAA